MQAVVVEGQRIAREEYGRLELNRSLPRQYYGLSSRFKHQVHVPYQVGNMRTHCQQIEGKRKACSSKSGKTSMVMAARTGGPPQGSTEIAYILGI